MKNFFWIVFISFSFFSIQNVYAKDIYTSTYPLAKEWLPNDIRSQIENYLTLRMAKTNHKYYIYYLSNVKENSSSKYSYIVALTNETLEVDDFNRGTYFYGSNYYLILYNRDTKKLYDGSGLIAVKQEGSGDRFIFNNYSYGNYFYSNLNPIPYETTVSLDNVIIEGGSGESSQVNLDELYPYLYALGLIGAMVLMIYIVCKFIGF